MPIKSTLIWQEIHQWHDKIEAGLQCHNVHHISYTPDGASMECQLEHELMDEAIESSRTRYWMFRSPVPGTSEVSVTVPLMSNGKPRILRTDRKHSKKNERGSVQFRAHTLALGNYMAHFGQLKNIALSKISSLQCRNVIGVNKQDDCAVAQLFSSAIIDYLSSSDDHLKYGLTVYLYIVGELVDAQQCQHTGFNECMKILWCFRFFLNGWLTSIYDHSHYTSQMHFIS